MNFHLHFHGPITVHMEGATMADMDRIKQSLDQLQTTIDVTQDNVAALLTLIRANPTKAELAEIEQRLKGMQEDLGGTSFDAGTSTEPGTQEGSGELPTNEEGDETGSPQNG